MKVFISWSGQASRDVAEALRAWLPPLVQSADFWMSSQDIGSGTRWFAEIGRQLDETDFGIICLTPENRESPWLMFESGALAKRLDLARVVPLYIGLKPSEVRPPLGMFQGVPLTSETIFDLVRDLNGASERPVSSDGIKSLVDAMLPAFMDRVNPSIEAAKANTNTPAPSPEQESISELTNVVRDLQWQLERRMRDPRGLPPRVMREPALVAFSQPAPPEYESESESERDRRKRQRKLLDDDRNSARPDMM